jgi:hypothetical protein
MSFIERRPLTRSDSGRRSAMPYAVDAWTFLQAGADERKAAERFISASFKRAYGARLRRFFPVIMVLRHGGELAAACGLRYARGGGLFLEKYLDQPIELALSAAVGECVDRCSIVEVGNLAVKRAGDARDLIQCLTCHLLDDNMAWAVFTAVPALRNSFRRLGIPLIPLGLAAREKLAPAERAHWGTYYETTPVVAAVPVTAASRALRHPTCTR